MFCHWFPWLISSPPEHQALPLDLKPIIWWWSRSGGSECDVFGSACGRNRINYSAGEEGTLQCIFASYYLPLSHCFYVFSFLLSFLSEPKQPLGLCLSLSHLTRVYLVSTNGNKIKKSLLTVRPTSATVIKASWVSMQQPNSLLSWVLFEAY